MLKLSFDLWQLLLPSLGAVVVIIVYSLIIAKRYQKMSLAQERRKGYEVNTVKITDLSEGLWWRLTITIFFLSYVGFMLLFINSFNVKNVSDAIFLGLILWIFIAYIGYRITRKVSSL